MEITRDTQLTEDDIRGIGDRAGLARGRSPWAIPIPGFRTVAQVGQNAAARDLGPLSDDQMARIEADLGC